MSSSRYAAVAAVLVVVASIAVLMRAPAPSENAALPDLAAPAAFDLDQRLAEIQRYREANPDDFDGVISRLRELQRDPRAAAIAQALVQELAAARRSERQAAAAFTVLQRRAESLAKLDQLMAALQTYTAYTGAWAAETAAQRRQAAVEMQARLQAAGAARSAAAYLQLHRLERVTEIVELLLQQRFDALPAALEAARSDAQLQRDKLSLAWLCSDAELVATMPDVILRSLASDAGKDIRLSLKDGVIAGRILLVEDGRCKFRKDRRVDAGTISEVRWLRWDDLSADERLRRLGRQLTSYRLIMGALLEREAGRPERAEARLREVNSELAQALLAAVSDDARMQADEAIEILLNLAGVSPATPPLLAASAAALIERTPAADQLLDERARAFRQRFPMLAFAYAEFLDALQAVPPPAEAQPVVVTAFEADVPVPTPLGSPAPTPEAEAGTADPRLTELASDRDPQRPRLFMRSCLGRPEDRQLARTALSQLLIEEAERRSLSSNNLEKLASALHALAFLELCDEALPKPDLGQWLCADATRLAELINLLTPQDHWPKVLANLDRLYRHAPDDCDDFFNLMLALAVVWDEPLQPIYHFSQTLPFTNDLVRRFGFFRDQYAAGKARVDYKDLTARALVFVVHTPVPLVELIWARDHVDGDRKSWGDKYTEIAYDRQRLASQQYAWPYGIYKLEDIRAMGGFHADQAYYAVMTARAHGIPAILFNSRRLRSDHAWFSFMKSAGAWEVDIGRDTDSKLAWVQAQDPQSDSPMTDHQVAFSYRRSFRSPTYDEAKVLSDLAKWLCQAQPKHAIYFADHARQLEPIFIDPWRTLVAAYLQLNQLEDAVEVLDDQAKAFREFPDLVYDACQAEAQYLRQLQRDDEAEAVLNQLYRQLDQSGNLAGKTALEAVAKRLADNDREGARKVLEAFLSEHVGEGTKLEPQLRLYMDVTDDQQMRRLAVSFLLQLVKRAPSDSVSVIARYYRAAGERYVDGSRAPWPRELGPDRN